MLAAEKRAVKEQIVELQERVRVLDEKIRTVEESSQKEMELRNSKS